MKGSLDRQIPPRVQKQLILLYRANYSDNKLPLPPNFLKERWYYWQKSAGEPLFVGQ